MRLYAFVPSTAWWADAPTRGEVRRLVRQASPEGREAVWLELRERLVTQNPLLTTLGRHSRDFQAGIEDVWEGYIVFGDAHVERVKAFKPESVTFECGGGNVSPDDLFDADIGFNGTSCGIPKDSKRGGDTWLGVFSNELFRASKTLSR